MLRPKVHYTSSIRLLEKILPHYHPTLKTDVILTNISACHYCFLVYPYWKGNGIYVPVYEESIITKVIKGHQVTLVFANLGQMSSLLLSHQSHLWQPLLLNVSHSPYFIRLIIVTRINSVVQLEFNFTVTMRKFKNRLSQTILNNNNIFRRFHFANIQNLWA